MVNSVLRTFHHKLKKKKKFSSAPCCQAFSSVLLLINVLFRAHKQILQERASGLCLWNPPSILGETPDLGPEV